MASLAGKTEVDPVLSSLSQWEVSISAMHQLQHCMGPLSLAGSSSGTQTTSVCSGGLKVSEDSARALESMLSFMTGRTPLLRSVSLINIKAGPVLRR